MIHHTLREHLREVAPYPPGVIAIPEPIAGTAFFPGGSGIWQGEGASIPPRDPVGGIMILGHDFHSEEGYERSLKLRGERLTDPTWRNLLLLLRGAQIPLNDCFFTNFYMGLRKGKAITGVFPGAKDKAFVARCQSFFLKQVETQHPKVILTLGGHVPSLIAPLAPQLNVWKGVKKLKDIDAKGAALVHGVQFGEALPRITVAALTHPSLWHANVGRREFQGEHGHPAELRMLSVACS
jgi:hypothetical protein